MIALRNPDAYKSASAFAPIANPITSSLAQKGGHVSPHGDATALIPLYCCDVHCWRHQTTPHTLVSYRG
jgi:hypothetical protein